MDPLYWLRIIFASKKGTLMELGMSPILISTMFLHTLAGKKVIDVNMGNKLDRELFQAAQKLFGFLFTLMFAVCGLFSGMYGPIENLGLVSSILIVVQLLFAGGIILLLDELLQKGYGLGNGINLFIATNIFGMILWECLSPSSIMDPEGKAEFEGAVFFFLHALFIRPNKVQGLTDALMRSYGPNLMNLASTLIIILAVNYFMNFGVELGMQSVRVRNHQAKYPIKMIYTSNIPVLLQSSIVMVVYFYSQIIQLNFKGSYLNSFFGTWQEAQGTITELKPVGGFAYFLTAPTCITDIIFSPDRFIFYTVFMLASCAFFSRFWIDLAGSAPRDVCR